MLRELIAVPLWLRDEGGNLCERFVRAHHEASYAEIRFETVMERHAKAENGIVTAATEQERAMLGVTVMVGSGPTTGRAEVGKLLAPTDLVSADQVVRAIRPALDQAFGRARFVLRERLEAQRALGSSAWRSLELFSEPPPSTLRATVPARFAVDPTSVTSGALSAICSEASAAASSAASTIVFNSVSGLAEFRREVFTNSAGAAIVQDFAITQGDCHVVAVGPAGTQELFDTIGQQRGLEALREGCSNPLMPNPDLKTFATELAREAAQLAAAPALVPPEGDVTIVSDPQFNALLVHEIVGHPSEADRALKTEAAYAGRSWFLRSLNDNEIGKPIAWSGLSACSDPSLDGYGHYEYDHEGTAGRRAMHIERGVFREFLHSRATAGVFGVEPNGSVRASELRYVPLIRMSNTFFMEGSQSPESIIGDVEHGYYVCGALIPSIAESRENFRISARRTYEIDHGRLGRLYRGGSVLGDSRRFFMSVDAAGNDLRLCAVPNCGKGQPMQVKRMSNGGPTLRFRGRLLGLS